VIVAEVFKILDHDMRPSRKAIPSLKRKRADNGIHGSEVLSRDQEARIGKLEGKGSDHKAPSP
jgi:hypothetical protein